MSKIIEDLNWRYATKKFDPTKKISDHDIDLLKEVINLAPTSYGLQPFKVLIIEDPKLREQLVPASYGQEQVKDASHLFILCAYKELEEGLIHSYISNIAETREIEEEKLDGFRNMMISKALKMDPEAQAIWMAKQTYIALGQLMVAAANLRIDTTPMEGFDQKAVDKVLNLSEKNLVPNLIIPLGYRHDEDHHQHNKKVRRKDLFETI